MTNPTASEMKHTPGPWAFGSHVIQGADGRIVVHPDYPMTVYDARLIAAAPDMLAALRDLLSNNFDEAYRRGDAWAVNARAKGRDAIRKATEDCRDA